MSEPEVFLFWALLVSGIGAAIITTCICYFLIPWVHKRWDIEDSKTNNEATEG